MEICAVDFIVVVREEGTSPSRAPSTSGSTQPAVDRKAPHLNPSAP